MSVIVVTAADAGFFELLHESVRSLRAQPQGRELTVGVFDLGLTDAQRRALDGQVQLFRAPEWEFPTLPTTRLPAHFKALLARPFLRQYFPGFEVYLWLDADAWVQDGAALELLERGARRRGLAIVPELDRGYRLLFGGWASHAAESARWYTAAYGPEVGRQMAEFPRLNAGVFALHRDAPHWEAWAQALQSGLRSTCTNMSDQLALNLVVHIRGLAGRTELLPAWCNWTCHAGLPAWDRDRRQLVEPYLPHTPIGILHLTLTKHESARLPATDGGEVSVRLRYPAAEEPPRAAPPAAAPPARWDYVAPGLERVAPDACFPELVAADPGLCPWPYLRRDVPHRWYVDRRAPSVGFLSRDEANLLYNTARQFRGRRALEIGCWLGWSACHLALAGVELDVVDPILARPEFLASVRRSLQAAGVLDRVHLIAGSSPQAVEQLAQEQQRRWSLLFIDGDHTAPAPLRDATVGARLAADDAAVLFHDLVAPDVAQGLHYLRAQGWQTLVYQTMQIMGVAWRGAFQPVRHQPDPQVTWSLPAHLHGYPVSG